MIYDENTRTFWVIDQDGNVGKLTFEDDYEIEFEFVDDELGDMLSDLPGIERYNQVEQRGNVIQGFATAENVVINDEADVSELNILITASPKNGAGQVHFITLYWTGQLRIGEYLWTDDTNLHIYMTSNGYYQIVWNDNSTTIIRPDGTELTIDEPMIFRVSDDYLIGDRLYTMDGDMVYDYEGSMSVLGNYVLRYPDGDGTGLGESGTVVIVDLTTGDVVEEYELDEDFINLIAYDPEKGFAVIRTDTKFVIVSHNGNWVLNDWDDAYGTDDGLITYVEESRDVIMEVMIDVD